MTERARIERRLQPGRLIVTAECRADVERVTLRTPRDIRTLVPSAVGHAIYAVYDGGFSAGELVLTEHRRDGTRRQEHFPLGL